MSAALPDAPGSVTAYIGLGGNLGNMEETLALARERLNAFPGCRLGRISGLYRTEPQGLKDQPFFLNQAVQMFCPCAMRPEQLLDSLLALEDGFGRVRQTDLKNGPRPLDLDLLLFGDEQRNTPRLTLPHPRMLLRAFVLVPLAEIAPDLRFPDGIHIGEALETLDFSLMGNEILQT